jgi:hypothetical protein
MLTTAENDIRESFYSNKDQYDSMFSRGPDGGMGDG